MLEINKKAYNYKQSSLCCSLVFIKKIEKKIKNSNNIPSRWA